MEALEDVQQNITRDIVCLANKAEFKEVDTDNIDETLLSYGESLSNEELQQQCEILSDDTAKASESTCKHNEVKPTLRSVKHSIFNTDLAVLCGLCALQYCHQQKFHVGMDDVYIFPIQFVTGDDFSNRGTRRIPVQGWLI
jgi:hypothetical protein